jgi:DNA-binding winged helix-turn-helix (wHTH) protein
VTQPVATFGPFALHACGTLRADGQVVLLTPKEEAVLRLLVQADGRRVGKDELLAKAWPGVFASDTSLARCIHTLRRKLSEAGGGDCIRTSYGRGYQIAVEVRVPGEPPVSTRRPANLELTPGL